MKRKTPSTSTGKKVGTSKSKDVGTSRSRASASSRPYDHNKFVSWDAQDLFNSKVDKTHVTEREIDIRTLLNNCPKIHDELVCRGLGVFFEESNESNLAVVREFLCELSRI